MRHLNDVFQRGELSSIADPVSRVEPDQENEWKSSCELIKSTFETRSSARNRDEDPNKIIGLKVLVSQRNLASGRPSAYSMSSFRYMVQLAQANSATKLLVETDQG